MSTEKRKSERRKSSRKLDFAISPYPVTLHYLLELDNTTMTGVLARDTSLFAVKNAFTSPEGQKVQIGDTVDVSKRASFFARGRGHLRGMKKFISIPRGKLELKKRQQWSIDDMLEYIIKPAVEERGDGCALSYALDRRHVCDKEYDCYFVSVPYSIWFHGFAMGLKNFFKDRDPKEVYLWIDFIQTDPCMSESKRSDFECSLPSFLKNFKQHLIYFDGWGAESNVSHRKTITALHDGRCLWELYCAKEAGLETKVIMRPPTRSEFLQSFREGGLAYFEHTLRTLALPETCNRLVDFPDLFSSAEGGLQKVFHQIRAQLELWFVEEFANESGKIKQKHDIVFHQAARDLNRIAVILSRYKRTDAAVRLFRDCIELCQAGGGLNDPAVAFAKNNLALILKKEGQFDEAQELLEDALRILEESDEDFSSRIAVLVGNMATILESKGSLEEAEIERKRYVFELKRNFGETHKEVARALNALGALQIKLSHLEPAKESLLEALAIWESDSKEDEQELEGIVENLASVYELERGDEPESGSHHVETAKVLFNLAMLYKQSSEENPEQLVQYSERAVSVMEEVLGEEHPETLRYRDELLN